MFPQYSPKYHNFNYRKYTRRMTACYMCEYESPSPSDSVPNTHKQVPSIAFDFNSKTCRCSHLTATASRLTNQQQLNIERRRTKAQTMEGSFILNSHPLEEQQLQYSSTSPLSSAAAAHMLRFAVFSTFNKNGSDVDLQ
ncbi:hypothetical protein JOB18_041373 [Solea senegalensis]|uniref:Uncharacterized protein n=1 Tax=Solea senegalensis TaxID=28829 RepID=A0AAV6QBA1_SOLSE|nr:hypothetical protein JOB18_041373 [Solea senegalensis]